jgi:hypothetical protein
LRIGTVSDSATDFTPALFSSRSATSRTNAARRRLSRYFLAEGQQLVPLGQRPLAEWNVVAPGFFRVYGIPMMSGRDFTWADDAQAPRVVIVSQAMARRFWAGENPLGKHLIFTRASAI